MATGIAEQSGQHPRAQKTRSDATADRYIETQLAKTSAQVKATDLTEGLLKLLGAVLLSLLTFVVIDHWVWGLNFWVRLAALVWIGAIAAHYLVRQLLPPLQRSKSRTAGSMARRSSGIRTIASRNRWLTERTSQVNSPYSPCPCWRANAVILRIIVSSIQATGPDLRRALRVS